MSDIYAPVTGEVVAINQELVAEPGTINVDPFGSGWLFDVTVVSTGELLDPVGRIGLEWLASDSEPAGSDQTALV